MTYLPRILSLPALLKKKSFFLFGARGTGKSTLIRQQLGENAYTINLLKTDLFLKLNREPSVLEDLIRAAQPVEHIVIDEIQKIPILLNEVHRLIEEKQYHFLMTGSSARKLRRSGTNLLAGRAWQAALFPLTCHEIPNFALDRYLRYGGLPSVYLSDNPQEELYAYVDTYLKEEIQMESEVRRLQPFGRFLEVAALSHGSIINYTKIGNDAQIPPSTVREYYQLLEDTLIGFQLLPWTQSKKRKAIQTAKFYFFDGGVAHTLSGTEVLDRNSNLFGQAFEHFIANELRAYLSYSRIRKPLGFWRTTHGAEVDFLIGQDVGVEVKASKKISPSDYRNFRWLQEEKIIRHFYLVSMDTLETISKDNIHTLHWTTFLKKLWQGEIIMSDTLH